MDRAREKKTVSYNERRASPDKSPGDIEGSIDLTFEGGVSDQIEALNKKVDTMRKQMKDQVSNLRPITGCQFSNAIL
ncbi:hypothetical protein ACS0TY_007472 [Phlomoides rotata]